MANCFPMLLMVEIFNRTFDLSRIYFGIENRQVEWVIAYNVQIAPNSGKSEVCFIVLGIGNCTRVFGHMAGSGRKS